MNIDNTLLRELVVRYPSLEGSADNIFGAFSLLRGAYVGGGKLLCCGNGGSCADSDHIVGELMKSFKFKRRAGDDLRGKLSAMGENGALLAAGLEGALPAVSLCTHSALITALANDTDPRFIYAQQVLGLGRSGDVLIAISTSGNSVNCLFAAMTAKAMDIKVIAMTGRGGGKIAAYSDVLINVPAIETYAVQELHLPVYHCLCAMLEEEFFNK